MKITIALSGLAGSFSEEAALLYAQRQAKEADLVYALDMAGVLTALDERRAEYGIFPVVNSRGGLVREAFVAMGQHLFTLVDELWFEVYQCLMVLPGVVRSDIKKIATHPQAIAQCERYIRREFPNLELIEWADTAKAAEDLRGGMLSRDTAVIAPARSAELYGLDLIAKGIQDQHPNLTTFIIVKK